VYNERPDRRQRPIYEIVEVVSKAIAIATEIVTSGMDLPDRAACCTAVIHARPHWGRTIDMSEKD